MSIKKIMQGVIAVVVLLVIAIFWIKPMIVRHQLPKPVVIDTQGQPTMGNPAAKIHIVAFEDLKCVNCARFNRELFPFIQKHYIATNLATYTMINLAFVQGSLPAANAAHCIYAQNSALFFPFVEYVYAHQPPENTNWATIPTLMGFASKIPGVHMISLTKCLITTPYAAFIQNNLQLAIKIMPIVSTPSIYINGILVSPLTKNQIEVVMSAVR